MRLKAALLLVFGALALVATACGGEEAAPLPETVEGPLPDEPAPPPEEEPEEPPEEPEEPEEPVDEPDPERGRTVFAEGGCAGCHTFAEAGATGTIAPSLDDTRTPFDEAVQVITNGRGAMPAFADQLTEQQIQDVAAFISPER